MVTVLSSDKSYLFDHYHDRVNCDTAQTRPSDKEICNRHVVAGTPLAGVGRFSFVWSSVVHYIQCPPCSGI